jgi:hypothetical protein
MMRDTTGPWRSGSRPGAGQERARRAAVEDYRYTRDFNEEGS